MCVCGVEGGWLGMLSCSGGGWDACVAKFCIDVY